MFLRRYSPLFSRFLSSSVIFYILSGLTSLLNYAFYPAIARFINTSEYGQVQFLASMFAQLAIVSVILNILAVVISVKHKKAAEQQLIIDALNRIAQTFTVIVATVGILALLLFSNNLSLHSPLAIILIGIGLLLNVPFTIVIGQLQGNGRFIASGAVSAIASGTKLVLGMAAAVLGLGVEGIVASIALGLLVAWLTGLAILHGKHLPLWQHLRTGGVMRRRDFALVTSVSRYAVSASFVILLLTVLSSIDSIVSRIVLDTHAAGQYASIATVSKIILSVAMPIMWLALPPAVERQRAKVARLAIVVAIASFSAAALLATFPQFFTTTLIGVDPGAFIGYTWVASLSMALYATAYLIASSLVCAGEMKASLAIGSLAVALFIITYLSLPHLEPLLRCLYAQLTSGIVILGIGALRLFLKPQTSSLSI